MYYNEPSIAYFSSTLCHYSFGCQEKLKLCNHSLRYMLKIRRNEDRDSIVITYAKIDVNVNRLARLQPNDRNVKKKEKMNVCKIKINRQIRKLHYRYYEFLQFDDVSNDTLMTKAYISLFY